MNLHYPEMVSSYVVNKGINREFVTGRLGRGGKAYGIIDPLCFVSWFGFSP